VRHCILARFATHNSPLSPSFPHGSIHPEVLWRDDNFTAYRERPIQSRLRVISLLYSSASSLSLSPTPPPLTHRLQSPRPLHLLSRMSRLLHSRSLSLSLLLLKSSSDLPLLVSVRDLAARLLNSLRPSSTPDIPSPLALPHQHPPSSPVVRLPHRLHHLSLPRQQNTRHRPISTRTPTSSPPDQLGWFRGVAYSSSPGTPSTTS